MSVTKIAKITQIGHIDHFIAQKDDVFFLKYGCFSSTEGTYLLHRFMKNGIIEPHVYTKNKII